MAYWWYIYSDTALFYLKKCTEGMLIIIIMHVLKFHFVSQL